MNKINMFQNNSKATSPVIGVMLMVVVTVILAAAVSSYSSGMVSTTSTAPTAVFDVKIEIDAIGNMGPDFPISYMSIKEITGDAIQTKDLKIITIDAGNNVTEVLPNSGNTDYSYSGTYIDNDTVQTYSSVVSGTSPYWNNPSDGMFGTNPDKDFGNYTLKPGIVMIADEYNNYVGTTGMEAMFSEWSSVKDGDWVTVRIIHIPSQKVIFQTEVEVI